jgi:hypothetical protein
VVKLYTYSQDNANWVLTRLKMIAKKYGQAAVADYYAAICVRPEVSDHHVGWDYESLGTAEVVESGTEFTIKFPPASILGVNVNSKGGEDRVNIQYRLEILHQQPGNSVMLKTYDLDSVPPVYAEDTSVTVGGSCYRVMHTLISVEEVDGTPIITHQVRVK